MSDSTQSDADDLLHWLNAHSVSISDGIPVTLIQQKWIATRRSQEQLKASLELLFANELLAITPGLTPPHVRLSALGFQRLLASMDGSRLPAPMSTPAMPVPSAPLPRPPPVPPPAPAEFNFLERQPPSEVGLRNQILKIFRDLRLGAGQQLIAMTLARYWQEAGLRGEHLRAGLDVMLRDGYLERTVQRYETYWLLTAAGHAYLDAPITAPLLLALAGPMTEITESEPDEALRRRLLVLFRQSPAQRFEALLAQWPLGRDALIHALDLLCKSGTLRIRDEAGAIFELGPAGAA